MIDWERVAELREEIGPEDFAEVVDLFLTEVDAAIAGLDDLPPDARAWEEQMHFLKGAALNLGFAALARQCQQGESQAAAGTAMPVAPQAVRETFEAARHAFEQDLPNRFAA